MAGTFGALSDAKQDEGFWEPPRLDASMEPAYRDSLRTFLDDVSCELSALIELRPPSEKKGHQVGQNGGSAEDGILDMLGSKHCEYLRVTLPRLAADAALDSKSTRSNEFQMPSTPFVNQPINAKVCS
jgi:hypothetical protein